MYRVLSDSKYAIFSCFVWLWQWKLSCIIVISFITSCLYLSVSQPLIDCSFWEIVQDEVGWTLLVILPYIFISIVFIVLGLPDIHIHLIIGIYLRNSWNRERQRNDLFYGIFSCSCTVLVIISGISSQLVFVSLELATSQDSPCLKKTQSSPGVVSMKVYFIELMCLCCQGF